MTLATAVQGYKVRSGVGAQITAYTPSGSIVTFLGPGSVEFAPGSSVAGIMSPALEFVGSIVHDGAPGVPAANTEWTIRVLNRLFVTATGTQMTIGELMASSYWIGSEVILYLLVDDDGTWQSTIIAVGAIKDTIMVQDATDIRCVAGTLDRQLPAIPTVSEDSMNWGADEGERPEGRMGIIAPFFYGHFNPDALNDDSGSDFVFTEGNDILCAQLGIKFPMLPLAMLADMYHQPSGGSLDTDGKFILLGCGDTDGSVNFKMIGPGGGGVDDEFWDPEPATPNGGTENVHLLRLLTWDNSVDRGLAFCKDQSDDMDVSPTAAQKPWAGGGCWTTEHGSHTTRTNLNAKMQTFYLERVPPDWGSSEPDYWMGCIQSIALPAERLTQEFSTTGTILFQTTSGVTNAQNALDADLANYATIPTGERLSVTLPADGPSLGDVIHVRLNVLFDPSTSSDARIAMRYTPQNLAPLSACWNTQAGAVTNTVKHTSAFAGVMRRAVAVVQKRIGYAYASHGHNQWDFSEYSTSSPLQRYAWDVVIWPGDSGTLHVVRVWLEVIYRPRIGDVVDKRDGTQFAIETGFTPIVGGWGYHRVGATGGQHYSRRLPYTGGIPDPQARSVGNIGVHVTGHGPKDAGTPRYGVANAVIENPVRAMWHWLDKRGQYSTIVSTASAFGSFADAADFLDDEGVRCSIWSKNVMDTEGFGDALGAHAMCFFKSQPDQSSPYYKRRCFVDTPRPDLDFPARMYAADAKLWGWDDIEPATVKVQPTPLDHIRNRFVVRYGYHEPTRSFAYERMLDRSTTSLGTDATAYKDLCADSVANYKIEREETIELPWIWNGLSADRILKWHADLKCTPRASVTFRTWIRGYDLLEGHVIRFADEFATYFPYPILGGSADWSDHMFNVVSVKQGEAQDGFFQVDVQCVEVYTPAA